MKDKFIIRRIESEVEKTLKESGVKSLLVAVSGGADSMALLASCCRIAPRLNIRVEAVNCNFHLRGEESDRDSGFTADICLKLGVKLHSLSYDVDSYLRSHPGFSVEMACRELRYSDFFRIKDEEGFDRVAVAHNSDDDIETMILNMLRGSGSRGLKGMDKDNGKILRPILAISRKDIEGYLESIGMAYVIDSSNMTNEYRRNFIRHDMIPILESRWHGARKSLSRTLSILKEESEIIESHYRNLLDTLCPDSTTLLVYSDDVTTGLILRFIESFGGNTSIAEEIKASLGKEFRERSWKLSVNHRAVLERDRLVITSSQETGEELTLRWIKMEKSPLIMDEIRHNKSHNIIYLPHDESAYELRSTRKSYRMPPLGMKGTRLISDIISDARFDRETKSAIRVLARKSDGEIIWVTGLKRSRHELITDDCSIIYKASLSFGFHNEH